MIVHLIEDDYEILLNFNFYISLVEGLCVLADRVKTKIMRKRLQINEFPFRP